jgi:hypothetical protein
MPSEISQLQTLALSKLYSSNTSLHRRVLLRNSIIHSASHPEDTTPVSEYPQITPAYVNHNEEVDEEEEAEDISPVVEVDAFMFPDAGRFIADYDAEVKAQEAQWLDSLLETLAEDEDDDYPADSDTRTSPAPPDEDEEQLFSPTLSPLSSSDDLNQSCYYSSSDSVPYSARFAFDSSLSRDFATVSIFNSSLPSPSSSYEHPFPYHDIDDIEDSSVPDAIEDESDDESDATSTPSFGRSSTSLTLDTATSFSPEPSGLAHRTPVFSDKDKRNYVVELDPLPFPDEPFHYTAYSAF